MCQRPGRATLYHLARRGLRVLGIERYDIPNEMGSSHGITRMIRLAYHEHPSYVPLVRRAYEFSFPLQPGRRVVAEDKVDLLLGEGVLAQRFQGLSRFGELHKL